MTEREVFVAALHQRGADGRRAFLDDACGADLDLRGRVEALLAEHDGLGSFLERPAVPPQETFDFEPPDGPTVAATQPAAADEAAGGMIGPYKLLEVIGEGGMGTVWMAEQARPIRRRVALKVVKAGMDSRQVLARFEAERQALALMDHPNIAHVFDAGTTPAGRPYFAMELVKGVPLTRFCDDRNLSIADRLRVFQQVCHAVQHAHQKGVIHRDLKPSNVLVESHEGRPVPKVIDFGLAKAVGAAPLTDRSLFTHFGAVLGTPLYMAPEQAELGALDVDTRADVYALGVILYELLTGTTPIERGRLAAAAWDEVRRVIREEEPPTPSARLSTSEGRASAAAQRQMEPARLGRFLRGDLDWVVMKALAKERDRRYESAGAFAADVERFLGQEPVAAGPPTASYRFRRFIRRHRSQVIAAGLVLAALVAGIAGTTFGLLRAEAARGAAVTAQASEERRAEGERKAKLEAQARAADAEREKARAEEERRIARTVQAFLQDKLLGQADVRTRAAVLLTEGGAPGQAADLADNPTVRELLDRAAQGLAPDRIEANFPGQPLVQAELLHTVGRSYYGVAQYPRAVEFLERAAAIREARLGPDHPDTLAGLAELALVYSHFSDLKPRAVALLERVRDARRSRLGPDHRDTLNVERNLAEVTDGRDGRDVPNSLPLDREGLGQFQRIYDAQATALGPDDPDTLLTLQALGNATRRRRLGDNFRRAIELLEQAWQGQARVLGPDHPDTVATLDDLAHLYVTVRDPRLLPRALELGERAYAAHRTIRGANHPATLATLHTLAATYSRAQQLDRAIELFEEVLRGKEAYYGRRHPATVGALRSVGVNMVKAGRLEEAVPPLEEVFWGTKADSEREGLAGSTLREERRWAAPYLLEAYARLGRPQKAPALAKEALALHRQQRPEDKLAIYWNMTEYASRLDQLGAHAEADALFREALGAVQPRTTANTWEDFRCRSELGGWLAGEGRYAEAEPLLREGYAGLKENEGRILLYNKGDLPRAADRLVDLYTAWGKPTEAATWRAERAKYPPGPGPAAPPPRP